MYDTQEEGKVQYQCFPSESSKGILLCINGKDTHDGSWNSYALAYPEALPDNATLLKGFTFVSYNNYNYNNIWHVLSVIVPFVGWHRRMGCVVPSRWILYHWGELRSGIDVWLTHLMKAIFGEGGLNIEVFDGISGPACFEEAVEGNGDDIIGLTMFMRIGARSFKNVSVVTEIFQKECYKVRGSKLKVAYANSLSFCDQTCWFSPHGAQLTNMFMMDRNSNVMEFFPKGWLKLGGVGQYMYHWIASWSGMRYQGAWRDPVGDPCPYPEEDWRCFSIYKGGMIGHNETYFSEWAGNVLNQTKISKMEEASNSKKHLELSGCAC
ncbi:hypothetical protein GIB67_005652 [Kingdonia uniflora]|uniref:Uncharacterized protein n=1 Tax=Kingdonia uniflora TaxID=39325 RepID=A0A7J7NHX5_9MAGN|nr:hypothetical protein GIB67_005652 [Kingdonia uniflora]